MVTQKNIKLKKEQMLKCLDKNLGNVSNACKQVGIVRATFYNWVDADEDFAESWKDISEMCLDFAETSLKKQIKNCNTSATIFYLKCKGRERGYIEKQDVENTHNFVGGIPEEYED